MVPSWGLGKKKVALFPNSTSCATTRLTNKVQARTHSHLSSLVGYPSERTVWTCRAWGPLQRVFLTWFSGSQVTWMGLGIGISSGFKITYVHSGKSKVTVRPEFAQASNLTPVGAHNCLDCALAHSCVGKSKLWIHANSAAIFQGQNCPKLINTGNL